MLIYLAEKNGFNTSDSYPLDIFKYEHDKTEFKKLKFLSTKLEENHVENDMLKLQNPVSSTGLRGQAEEFADEDTVETYFDIFLEDKLMPNYQEKEEVNIIGHFFKTVLNQVG